jgi:hypothetical protein
MMMVARLDCWMRTQGVSFDSDPYGPRVSAVCVEPSTDTERTCPVLPLPDVAGSVEVMGAHADSARATVMDSLNKCLVTLVSTGSSGEIYETSSSGTARMAQRSEWPRDLT